MESKQLYRCQVKLSIQVWYDEHWEMPKISPDGSTIGQLCSSDKTCGSLYQYSRLLVLTRSHYLGATGGDNSDVDLSSDGTRLVVFLSCK